MAPPWGIRGSDRRGYLATWGLLEDNGSLGGEAHVHAPQMETGKEIQGHKAPQAASLTAGDQGWGAALRRLWGYPQPWAAASGWVIIAHHPGGLQPSGLP